LAPRNYLLYVPLHKPNDDTTQAAATPTNPTRTMVCEDKRRIIAYLWYLNALLSIAYVIVAICAAANQKDVRAREE
jgi:hypothetical protein